ncbi:hypothetical protein BN871_AT_00250 [Paenibacillus sp. P22]|nr:hypothetical protein BN871_AT_00250 [Paenibacillus sp. P22]
MGGDQRVVARFVRVSCECGEHLVDLSATMWNDPKIGMSECSTCDKPLVIRGVNGEFYFVGAKI